MFLAGDIGGTKTNVGLFDERDGQLVNVAEATYPSCDYPGLEEIASDFLTKQDQTVERACFGVAGPVQDGVCKGVNLPWDVDAGEFGRRLHIASVAVINDLEATAYSLPALNGEDFVPLKNGSPGATGNTAVIAAGTGLGEAGLFWDGKRHRPFACEGGHTDFGVRNALEADLLRFLLGRFEHVSVERVLSGPGLVEIYEFFRQRDPQQASIDVATQAPEAAAVVSNAALAQRCPVCENALDLFVTIYGAEAGNLALKQMATGGVYVGGGIAPKIIQKLKQANFVEAFVAKGRMRSFMEDIPVAVIMTDRAALMGAAEFARHEELFAR